MFWLLHWVFNVVSVVRGRGDTAVVHFQMRDHWCGTCQHILLSVDLASSVGGCIMVVENRGAGCGTMGNEHSPPMVAYLSSHAHPRTFALSLSLTAHALGHRCRRRGCLMQLCTHCGACALSSRPVYGAAPAASPPAPAPRGGGTSALSAGRWRRRDPVQLIRAFTAHPCGAAQ